MTFSPEEHLTTLKGKRYLEVKWRLVWLRSEHPDAQINTQILEHNETFALFRAVVSLTNGGSATGHGSETQVDFADFAEKAETKAIGRALGALGYGTQFCEDFDFAADAKAGKEKVVDSPVARQPATGAPKLQPSPPTPATSNAPNASELAKQGVAKGAITLDWLRQWCDARGVTKVDAAPEKDRVQLAHELANKLAAQG